MRLFLSNGIKEVDKMVETKVLNPKTRERRNRDKIKLTSKIYENFYNFIIKR